MNLDDYDHTYLINLNSRPDRLARASKACHQLGIQFERVPATDGKKLKGTLKLGPNPDMDINRGSAGLIETTIRIIKDAKKKKYRSILIMEDDVQFEKDAKEKIRKARFQLSDWQFFYFGAFHAQPPTKIDSHVVRLVFSFCCHAYAVNSTAFDEYLRLLLKRDRPIDWVIATHFQPKGMCYGLKYSVAIQYPSYSDISEKFVDQSHLINPNIRGHITIRQSKIP